MKRYLKVTLVGACALLGLGAVSCTPGERGAVVGGAIGAGTGALIGDGTGALIGGAIGAVAGSEISKNRARRNYWGY
ncbi:MAG: YMGG-like glycine zipper-containing protein [Verrucomicrobiota bacterium]